MERGEETERKECPSCQRSCHANAKYCAGCGGKFAGKNVEPDGGELRTIVRGAIKDELDEREAARREKKKETAGKSAKSTGDDAGDFGNWGND